MALGKCKECGKEISSQAKACPHCGAKQRNKAAAVAVVLILGAIIVTFTVISMNTQTAPNGEAAAPPSDSDTAASAPAASAMQVNALQLAQAFQANEVAAQKTYGGQVLDVTGTITGVVLDIFNNPVIHLESGNQFLPVQASFDKSYGDKIGALSKGQQITVECTSLTSVISAPMLSDCTLPNGQ
jgi:hypothetical protein